MCGWVGRVRVMVRAHILLGASPDILRTEKKGRQRLVKETLVREQEMT